MGSPTPCVIPSGSAFQAGELCIGTSTQRFNSTYHSACQHGHARKFQNHDLQIGRKDVQIHSSLLPKCFFKKRILGVGP